MPEQLTLAEGTTTHFPYLGENEPALLKILRAAVVANPVMLDRTLLNGSHYDTFLGGLNAGTMRLYLDVPVCRVLATQHKNFDSDASTWRAALGALKGENNSHVKWDDRLLAYLESEIGEQVFPCDAASNTLLTLDAWGGAVFCSNGAHRLTAGMAWLAAKHGDAGLLRKVRVTHYRLNEGMLRLMADAARRGKSISFAGPTWKGRLVRIRGKFLTKYWFVDKGSDRPRSIRLAELRGLFGVAEAPGEKVNDGFIDFWPFPAELALALPDDGWLQEQLKAERYAAVQ